MICVVMINHNNPYKFHHHDFSMAYTEMSPEEFVGKLIEGERDLHQTKLPDHSDLTLIEGYQEIPRLLRSQGGRVNLAYSYFRGLIAPGLWLPESYLININLPEANITGSNLSGANLFQASLNGTDLSKVNLFGAILQGSDLRGAKNLEKAVNLGHAKLLHTKVTEREREICQAKKDKTEPMFELRTN